MSPWIFISADDDELQEILAGKRRFTGYPWPSMGIRRSRSDEVGALVSNDTARTVPPACLVVSKDASRRLFGRYSQLRSDLSPLSAWTHVMDWEHFEQLEDEGRRIPQLAGLDAAWVALSIAEALMLSDRPLAQLKLAPCLATSSYTVARTRALWPNESVATALERYDLCHKLVRSTEASTQRLRSALIEIWEVLAALSDPLPRSSRPETRALSECLRALQKAREQGLDELDALTYNLELPQSDRLRALEAMPAEIRVKEFDRLIRDIESLQAGDHRQRNQLFFLAGYLATVAAGGAPSLSLAERLASRYPQITAWAYVIGSIGENVTWTSAFDGLGRLVARELQRPFRVDEAPSCDFALTEAAVLVDRALQDPLVHLRVKQIRVLTVGLLPGVNVTLPLGEPGGDVRSRPSGIPNDDAHRARINDPMQVLAKALAPYIIEEIDNAKGYTSSAAKRSTRSRNVKSDRLPLNEDD